MDKAPKPPSLYVLKFENELRFSEITEALNEQSTTSEVIVDFDAKGLGRTYATIVLNDAEIITHICRMVRLRAAGLYRRTVHLSELERIDAKASSFLANIIQSSTNKQRRDSQLSSLGPLKRDEARRVIEALDNARSYLGDELRRLGMTDERILTPYTEHEREIIALERDAFGLALEIAFDDREQLVIGAAIDKHASFISMLYESGYIEDEIISFDKDRFPGLDKLVGTTPRVARFKHNDSILRVIHANRNSLEHTLGVDLIYISEYFGSLVGIQYKMMEGAPPFSHFYPTAGFRNQLEKMNLIWSNMPASNLVLQRDYHLNDIPFYFKFVSRLERNFSDDSLCPGMYLPADFVYYLMALKSEKIGTKHQTRHLSNTEFSNLVRQGWIGSDSHQTRILQALVEQAQNENRSITIAIQEGAPPLIQRSRAFRVRGL
jgi:hypothetical protein